MLRTRPAPHGAGRACFRAAILGVMLSTSATAHDIPDEIVLHGFVKPEGDRLHFVVRVPLVMLQSMNLPKRGPGYVDLPQADEKLQAAAAATAKEIELYENGAPLTPAPREDADIAALRPVTIRDVCKGARQHRGAEAAGHDRRLLEPGVLRRAPGIPDPFGAVRAFLARHAACPGAAGPAQANRQVHATRRTPPARTSFTGAPVM